MRGNTSTNPMGSSIVAANTQNMSGINTLGILMAQIDVVVEGVVPAHIHSHRKGKVSRGKDHMWKRKELTLGGGQLT